MRYQKAKFRHIETLFLSKAVDILCESRRTLMYTYAFAFYLQKDNAQTVHYKLSIEMPFLLFKDIFEDNQRDLEVATEQLSEYLERDMEGEEELNGLKQKA